MPLDSRPKVLIIDDQGEYLEALDFSLRDEFEVITATSGLDGYALACERKPDLIVVDVMMPVIDGWTLLRKLKINPAFTDTPIIVVSAVSREKVRQEADPGQVDAVLQKPCEPDRVAAAIRSALTTRRSRSTDRPLSERTS